MKNNQPNKEKYGFHLRPEISDLIDTHLETADARSRSDFVRDAVKYYCCYLDADRNKDVLSTEVIKIVRASVKDTENHLASILFKVAGELALQNYLIGEFGISLTDQQIQMCRNIAYDKVRRQHGFIRIEQTLEPEA